MNQDLTVGKPEQVLWRFCLPLFGSMILQQLYNLADSWVAGFFIGQNALAAVGNSYEVTLIFLAFAFGCNMGCSVITSQLFGAKEYADMKTGISTAMLAAGFVCIALMAAGIAGRDTLLQQIQTPAEVFADSRLYLTIYTWGLPFVFFYNLSTGIFSALGDSKTPFLFLAISSLSNIAMDILFVTAFDMGVSGVAWATFLCQGVSCIGAVTVIARRLQGLPGKGKLFSGSLLSKFAGIAIPSTMQQGVVSVGNIVIQGVINGFGTEVMAGYSAAVKLNNLVISSFTTLGNGISNFAAQNLGAKKPERIHAGFKAGVKLVWILCVPLTLGYFGFGSALMGFFLKMPTQTALNSGVLFLRIVSPFYCIISVKLISDGILRGTGRMKQFTLATISAMVLRVTLVLFLSGTALGATGIWCAWPFGWILAAGISLSFYLKGIREKQW